MPLQVMAIGLDSNTSAKLQAAVSRDSDFKLVAILSGSSSPIAVWEQEIDLLIMADLDMHVFEAAARQVSHSTSQIIAIGNNGHRASGSIINDRVLAVLPEPLGESELSRTLALAKSKLLSARMHDLWKLIGTYLKYTDSEKLGGSRFPCPPSDIEWIESEGNYLVIHAESGSHPIRMTMNMAEALLKSEPLVRIHRALMVNIARIRSVSPGEFGAGFVITSSGQRLRVSRAFWSPLRQRLEQFRDFLNSPNALPASLGDVAY